MDSRARGLAAPSTVHWTVELCESRSRILIRYARFSGLIQLTRTSLLINQAKYEQHQKERCNDQED